MNRLSEDAYGNYSSVLIDPAQAAVDANAQAVLDGVVGAGALTAALVAALAAATALQVTNNAIVDNWPASDITPMVCVQFVDDAEMPDSFKPMLATIKTEVVDNREAAGGHLIEDHDNKEVFVLYKRKTGNAGYGYFRLRYDCLNTFRAVNDGAFQLNNFGGRLGANPAAVNNAAANFRQRIWRDFKMIQIESLPILGAVAGTRILKEGRSQFRNEAGFEVARRTADGGARGLAQDAAEKISETDGASKPFYLRSQYHFMNSQHAFDTHLLPNANVARPGRAFPIAEAGGQFSAAILPFFNDNEFELFIPVRNKVINKSSRPTKVTIESIEPFFGYCSGTSQLMCKEPLNTARLGKNYPIIVQDMEYTFQRDAQPMFTSGYLHDNDTILNVQQESELEFTYVSEKLPGVRQQDKSVMSLTEISSTFNEYSKTAGINEIVTFEVEEAYGQFEYLFLYTDYLIDSTETTFLETDPVITSIQYKVRGRENLFVRDLDRFDLERISRSNCNRLSNWRELHNNGQGILIHLADLGLTEEIAFPEKKRIQLEFSVLTWKNPESSGQVARPTKQTTHCVFIRQNQLFKASHERSEFLFLNDK